MGLLLQQELPVFLRITPLCFLRQSGHDPEESMVGTKFKLHFLGWPWWCTPVILSLGSWRQEDEEFKVNLQNRVWGQLVPCGSVSKVYLKNNNKIKTKVSSQNLFPKSSIPCPLCLGGQCCAVLSRFLPGFPKIKNKPPYYHSSFVSPETPICNLKSPTSILRTHTSLYGFPGANPCWLEVS